MSQAIHTYNGQAQAAAKTNQMLFNENAGPVQTSNILESDSVTVNSNRNGASGATYDKD